jgi:hypothetical protein
MLTVKWFMRLLSDAVLVGVTNRTPLQSAVILFFLVIGLVIVASQVSAPVIYTLF